MLVSMKEILNRAHNEHYGVPATEVDNEHNVRACIEAAEEMQSPIILLNPFPANPDIQYLGRIATDLASKAAVPVAVCQDHGATFEEAIWAIRAGFTDIMVDRSSLAYDENVSQVKELTRIAHAVGVNVEAELGHVGVGENYAVDGISNFTDPDEAVRFVAETGVDALAVAVGTAHGIYKGEPRLQFDLLAELREKVSVPLVLHGGSGTGDENLAKACECGICKVNLANDLYRAAIEELVSQDLSGNQVYALYPLLAAGYKNKVMHFMTVTGSKGKAWNAVRGLVGKSTEGFTEVR